MQTLTQNNIRIKRTRHELRVEPTAPQSTWADGVAPLEVQIEANGRRIAKYDVTPDLGFEESLQGVDFEQCSITVARHGQSLAVLPPVHDDGVLPFMRLSAEQVHVTEPYVSVPPALHITDEIGAVWTFGMGSESLDKAPRGEFAFEVVRDGIPTGEIASRIERRSGKIKIFTKHGWKTWSGRTFV